MTDLSNPNKLKFEELDDETAVALFRYWREGGKVQFWSLSENWMYTSSPSWLANSVYRAKPVPVTQDSIDWSHVAPKAKRSRTCWQRLKGS